VTRRRGGSSPNIHLEQAAFNRIIEQDLRLALSDGLDSLVVGAFAASGFQAPGTDNPLVSWTDHASNLQPLCRACNQNKSDR
jgi:hypothetical protein